VLDSSDDILAFDSHYNTVRLDEKREAMEAVVRTIREQKVGTLVGTPAKAA
jgi:hypothetical protein